MAAIAYSVVLWCILGGWIRRRRGAGPLLLDLGRDASATALVLLGCVLLLAVGFPLVGAGAIDPAATIGGLSCAAYCLVTGGTSTQLRTNGLVGGMPLFPHYLEWRRVDSYDISGRVLGLAVWRRWSLPGFPSRYRLNLRLPPRRGAEAEEILRRCVSE